MKNIHDRMPVILEERAWDEWLDPANDKTESLQELLKPCPSKWLESIEISTLINSPKNNRADVLEPLARR